MPNDYTEQTIRDVYHDDYADSSGFHQILFNSSRYLQARELTQLQSILQNQVSKFADNYFQDGAPTSGTGSTAEQTEYVLVNTTALGNASIKRYLGKTLKSPAIANLHGGLEFTVSFAVDAVDGESYATLYGNYVSANQQASGSSSDEQGSILKFAEGVTLSDTNQFSPLDDLLVETRSGVAPLPTGQGFLIGIQASTFYTQGHFVFAPSQQIVVSPYDPFPNVDIGFRVIQDIITVEDDTSLYDNQGAVPNLASPGADRYRIRLELTTKKEVADPLDFMPFATIKDGQLVKEKTPTNSFNEVENRMAVRQFDTNGDFIVNPFGVSFQPGNTLSTVTMTVEGLSSRGEATAFVDGYRLVQGFDSDYQILKPVSITTLTDTSTTVEYRNFVPVDNSSVADAGMGKYPSTGNIELQQTFNLYNDANVVIGTTRIKSFKRFITSSPRGIQVYLYDIRMNVNKNFRDVEFIGSDPTIGFPITQDTVGSESNTYIVDPEINSSLFEIPGGRVKSISDVSFTSQRYFNVQTNSGSVASINAGTSNTFENVLEWFAINRSSDVCSGITQSQVTISGTGATIDFPNIADNQLKNYTIFAYARNNAATPKMKHFKRSGYEQWTASSATSDFTLATKKYDGVRLISARTATGATGGTDLSDLVEFDGGQRDNFYSPIVIKRGQLGAGITQIWAKIEYFDWQGTGDFLCASSYRLTTVGTDTDPIFSYSDIPTYNSSRNGIRYDLRNYFDFRSILDPSAATMSVDDRFKLPKDGGQIVYDVEFYNRRIDNVSLGYTDDTRQADIRIITGEEELTPNPKGPAPNEMILFSINYGGNTISPTDITIIPHTYKRFTMKDIENLESRVDQLEETVSLSFLESSAAQLVEIDGDGGVRSKTGFFVDDFQNGLALTASTETANFIEDKSFVHETLLQLGDNQYAIEPKNAIENISMLFDSGGTVANGYPEGDPIVIAALGDLPNINYKRFGDTLYLDYIETLDSSMINEAISWKDRGRDYEESGYYNVNPFNVFMGEGSLKLSPEEDLYSDNIHLPTKNIISTNSSVKKLLPVDTSTVDTMSKEVADYWTFLLNVRDFGKQTWGNFKQDTIKTRTKTTSRSSTRQTGSKSDKIAISYPWMRSRPILCKCLGLRPKTRYWPYFDNVEVSKWSKSLTQNEYQTKINNREHLKTYVPVDVNITQHPDTPSTLISSPEGEIYYSFFLPNSAPLPSNNGRAFSTFAEWEGWIAEQQRLANETSSSIKDPAVYDTIGWKFRCGNKDVKLLDVSPVGGQGADEANALSRASAIYRSEGDIVVQQQTNYYSRTVSVTTQEVTSGNQGHVIHKKDPLAQSFSIDSREGVPGGFITKVDVFLRRAPQTSTNNGDQLAIPIQLQIREMEAGFPKSHPVTEQFRVYKRADDCYNVIETIKNMEGGLEKLENVLSNPVTFEFEEPIYIEGGREYAVVLLAECDNYEAFISTTYGLVLGKTTHRINKQPSSGSLFLSQNGTTWTPKQEQNLAYRIYTAKFKASGRVNFVNANLPKHLHNEPLLSIDPNSLGYFRVNHFAHGLGVGDKVGLTGLTPATSYFGVQGSVIMDAANVVAGGLNSADNAYAPDAYGYFVKLSSGTFNTGGIEVGFGEKVCKSNRAFNFDRAQMNFASKQFQGTSTNYSGNFTSGNTLSKFSLSGTQDPRFRRQSASEMPIVTNIMPLNFAKPKMLANPDMEEASTLPTGTDALDGPSLLISAAMNSTISSSFGNTTAQEKSDGYISDVSPIIDLQKCAFTLQNFLIDNQVLEAADSPDEVNNKPFFYVEETNSKSGSVPSKHITKPIILEQSAQGVKVFLDLNRPPSSNILLYYRLANADDEIFDVDWILISPQNEPPANKFEAGTYDILNLVYSEYAYLIGGVNGFTDQDFTSFQLKVVMNSTNSCEIPVLKSIRAIALI
jgi:hypothetical protein